MGVTNAVTMPVSRSVTSSIVRRTLGIFSPLSLFANGEQGAWYDPSDLSTLYQDAAGTIPVTADGQPVGRMEDKSGNGNHATQSVAASRPTYRTDGTLHWLEFDGVDDYLTTPVVALSSSKSFLVAGGVKDNANNLMVYFESGTDYRGGGFGLFINDRGLESAAVSGDGGQNRILSYQNTGQEAKVQSLYGGLDTLTRGRLNGVQASDLPASGGVFQDRVIGIGRREPDQLYLNGNIYGLVLAQTENHTTVLSVEEYLAQKSGVILP